jgi:inorganic pyrophosphatase/exopolyphosphatase
LSQCKKLSFAGSREVEAAGGYVLVDGSELQGLPREINPERVVEVIDHRLHHKAEIVFPKALLNIEPVGAAATLVAERFKNEGVIPSYAAGILLYGAVHSNTQCLKGAVTSERDVVISSWLEKVIPIPEDLLDGQFDARREEIVADLSAAINRESKTYHHPTGTYVISQIEIKGATKLVECCLESLITYTLQIGMRTMLNLVDISNGKAYLIVPDPALQAVVSRHLAVDFQGMIAESAPAVLRKQILAAMENIPWQFSQ